MDTIAVQAEDTQYGRYLTFALGKESFGLEIRHVKEIVGMQPVTQLPDVPGHVKGIINLRGNIIPVIDMRLLFGKESIDYTDRTCIIVADIDDTSAGLIVDRVSEVLSIDDGDIVPPPAVHAGMQNRSIKAIGKAGDGVKLLLDCSQILNRDEISSLRIEEETIK